MNSTMSLLWWRFPSQIVAYFELIFGVYLMALTIQIVLATIAVSRKYQDPTLKQRRNQDQNNKSRMPVVRPARIVFVCLFFMTIIGVIILGGISLFLMYESFFLLKATQTVNALTPITFLANQQMAIREAGGLRMANIFLTILCGCVMLRYRKVLPRAYLVTEFLFLLSRCIYIFVVSKFIAEMEQSLYSSWQIEDEQDYVNIVEI